MRGRGEEKKGEKKNKINKDNSNLLNLGEANSRIFSAKLSTSSEF